MKMNLVSLFLVAIVAFNAISAQSLLGGKMCTKYQCAKKLKECGNFSSVVVGTDYVSPGSNSYSPFSAYTSCTGENQCVLTGNRGICISPVELGEPCGTATDDNKCESGTRCVQSTGSSSSDPEYFCAQISPAVDHLYPGESCHHDTQCVYSLSVTGEDTIRLCNGGHCKKVNNGEYCSIQGGISSVPGPTAISQCQYGKSYCGKTNRCEKNIKKGGLCNTNDVTQFGCGRTSRCIPTSSEGSAGTCQPFASLKEGYYCRSIIDCKEGLYCGEPRSGEQFGVCTKPIETVTLNKRCPSLNDTLNGLPLTCNATNQETCQCTDDGDFQTCSLSVYPKGYFKAVDSYNECARKKCGRSGTPSTDTSFPSNRCIFEKCRNQACKSFELQKKVGSYPASSETVCMFQSYCDSGFILSVSPFLILSALVAVFLF